MSDTIDWVVDLVEKTLDKAFSSQKSPHAGLCCNSTMKEPRTQQMIEGKQGVAMAGFLLLCSAVPDTHGGGLLLLSARTTSAYRSYGYLWTCSGQRKTRVVVAGRTNTFKRAETGVLIQCKPIQTDSVGLPSPSPRPILVLTSPSSTAASWHDRTCSRGTSGAQTCRASSLVMSFMIDRQTDRSSEKRGSKTK